MSESPQGDEARRIVDDLENEIVDVDGAQAEQGASDEGADGQGEGLTDDQAEDQADSVPGSPEPTD